VQLDSSLVQNLYRSIEYSYLKNDGLSYEKPAYNQIMGNMCNSSYKPTVYEEFENDKDKCLAECSNLELCESVTMYGV